MTSVTRTRPSLYAGLTVWLCLMTLPAALSHWWGPTNASLVTLSMLVGLLWMSRSRVGRRRGSALVVFALAGLSGWLAAPAWAALVSWLGGWAGLVPPAPAFAAAPISLWLCAVGLGPVVEELLYRERLLEALRGVGVGFAVASTSLLSALSHPEPWGRLAALVLGVGLGLVRFRSRSTAACIGHHAGLNAAALHCWSTPGCEGLPAPFSALVGGACLAIALWWRRGALRPVLLGALLAAPAGAEVLLFEGELSYEPVAAAIPALTVAGVGVATVNESGGGIALETLALAGGPTGLTGSAIVPITDPVVSNGGIVALGMSAAVGAGTLRPFQPTSPSVGRQLTQATLPVAGDLRLCMLIPSCSVPFGIGLSTPGGAGVGVGGLVTAHPQGTVMLSLYAAPWTIGSATLPIATSGGGSFVAVAAGLVHGPYSFTGSTALPGGEVQLVAPVRIVANLSGPAPPSGFARLRIHFVPEPRSLWLLGPGLAGIALAARRRSTRGDS